MKKVSENKKRDSNVNFSTTKCAIQYRLSRVNSTPVNLWLVCLVGVLAYRLCFVFAFLPPPPAPRTHTCPSLDRRVSCVRACACAAKGRTNIELREQFILADGVSQSMSAFKSKPSPNAQQRQSVTGSTGSSGGSLTGGSLAGSAGPITKVGWRSTGTVPSKGPTSHVDDTSNICDTQHFFPISVTVLSASLSRLQCLRPS